MNYDPDSYNGLDKMPTLYAKSVTGAITQWTCWAEGSQVHVEWGQVGGQLQHAAFECEGKNKGRSNETSDSEQAIKEAISKWKKQVKKKYHVDPNHWEENRNLKPMLAKDYKKQKKAPTYPAHVQPKLDGVRCLAFLKDGQAHLLSRGGDPYVVHHIQGELRLALPPGYILDGELYHHGTALQTISSWVRRPQEASINVEYHVYDVYMEDEPEMPWSKRFETLQHFFTSSLFHFRELRSISLVETHVVNEHIELEQFHNDFVAEGYEGAIYRSLGGVYKFGYRSSDLLKYKAFQDDEFLIVGWKTGKGKFANVPIFECVCGERTFEVTPMGNEAERLEMLRTANESVGKMLTVRYFNYTPDGVPFHPVGVAIREPGT